MSQCAHVLLRCHPNCIIVQLQCPSGVKSNSVVGEYVPSGPWVPRIATSAPHIMMSAHLGAHSHPARISYGHIAMVPRHRCTVPPWCMATHVQWCPSVHFLNKGGQLRQEEQLMSVAESAPPIGSKCCPPPSFAGKIDCRHPVVAHYQHTHCVWVQDPMCL